MAGEKPGVAVRVVLKRGGKIILIQRSDLSSRNAKKWEIPGGVVDFLEEILPALKREVLEEIGTIIYPSRTTPLTTVKNRQGQSEHIFICTRFRRRPGSEQEIVLSEEHRRFRWVPVEKALGMELTPVTQAVMEFLLD